MTSKSIKLGQIVWVRIDGRIEKAKVLDMYINYNAGMSSSNLFLKVEFINSKNVTSFMPNSTFASVYLCEKEAREAPLTLGKFLKYYARSDTYVYFYDGWYQEGMTYIDNEDLFFASLNSRYLDRYVKEFTYDSKTKSYCVYTEPTPVLFKGEIKKPKKGDNKK